MFASGNVDLEVAAIGGCAVVLAAAIPAWLNARRTRHAVGKPNGRGTVVQMLEESLENQGELRGQIRGIQDQVSNVKTQIEFVSSVQEAHALEDAHNQKQTEKHFRVVFNHLGIPYDEENPDVRT